MTLNSHHAPRAGVLSVAAGLFALVLYSASAARTITWWEGSQYPLAAWTLGITAPPGSLLLTLFGWLMSHVPFVPSVAFRLNLAAAALGATTVALVTRLSIRFATPDGREEGGAEVMAGLLVGLAFAFSLSIWTHAVQFKPYILTACFTALILAAALTWWTRASQADAPGRLFVIFLLIGLDFSVHRTNSLLLPAVLFWITLRRPRVWRRPRPWGAMGAGLVLGLSFHLLLIPLSLRDPSFDLAEPRNLAGLWSYVSLRQMGGGFLFHILPRRADLLHVQLADYLQFFGTNVLPPLRRIPLALLPGALIVLGWILALGGDDRRRRGVHPDGPAPDGTRTDAPDDDGGPSPGRRRFLGLLGFLLCASLGAVVYFNLPAHYFRTMDRHYLPSLVLFAPLAAIGIAALFRRIAGDAAHAGARAHVRRWLRLAPLGALFLIPPVDSWVMNHRSCDLSHVRFAESYSQDVLRSLPPRAILLTNGDNDTFPLWYLQQVEGLRRDVAVINIPLTNMDSYVARIRRRELRGTDWPAAAESRHPASVPDTTVTIPVGAALRSAFPARSVLPDSFRIHLGGLLLPQDQVALDLLRFASERPLYIACTVSPGQLAWLRPYLRLDGLAYRVVPSSDPSVSDLAGLRRRLLERVGYAGVADPRVVMDPTSRAMCQNYRMVLVSLAQDQLEKGDPRGCLETLRFADAKAPPERLGVGPDALAGLWARADSAARANGIPVGPAGAEGR